MMKIKKMMKIILDFMKVNYKLGVAISKYWLYQV